MFKKNLIKLTSLGAFVLIALSSCQKEDVLAPDPSVKDSSNTIIYIRAVDKDSSVVESEQLLLR
jgi:hypothetical protein